MIREIWDDYQKWYENGKQVTLATVVSVQGTSLRPAGSKMIFSSNAELSGSVSGGCVEGAVFEVAQEVAKHAEPQLVSYGISNEAAWEVGLSCGGELQVFVESMSTTAWKAVLPGIHKTLAEKQIAALVTILAGPGVGQKLLVFKDGQTSGNLGATKLERQLLAALPANWAAHDPLLIKLTSPKGESTLFVEFLLPPPRLIIVGAVHMAIALVDLAKTLNFHTIVVDARRSFATRERFPTADELIVDWPSEALAKLSLDPSTCVVCLSHDDKQDIPALLTAIASPVLYIGALGSRVTHAARVAVLKEEGATDEQLKRIHAPVGFKLGGKQPAEIALGIMAEIVAEQHGGMQKS